MLKYLRIIVLEYYVRFCDSGETLGREACVQTDVSLVISSRKASFAKDSHGNQGFDGTTPYHVLS